MRRVDTWRYLAILGDTRHNRHNRHNRLTRYTNYTNPPGQDCRRAIRDTAKAIEAAKKRGRRLPNGRRITAREFKSQQETRRKEKDALNTYRLVSSFHVPSCHVPSMSHQCPIMSHQCPIEDLLRMLGCRLTKKFWFPFFFFFFSFHTGIGGGGARIFKFEKGGKGGDACSGGLRATNDHCAKNQRTENVHHD